MLRTPLDRRANASIIDKVPIATLQNTCQFNRNYSSDVLITVDSLLDADKLYYVDVNRDGVVTPLDALLVLIQLSRRANVALGEASDSAIPLGFAELFSAETRELTPTSEEGKPHSPKNQAKFAAFTDLNSTKPLIVGGRPEAVSFNAESERRNWAMRVDSAIEEFALVGFGNMKE